MTYEKRDVYTLVTGASGGIGKEIAREFALRGNNLILIARSESKLKELVEEFKGKYFIKVLYFVIDFCQKDAAERVFTWCENNNLQIDILVNNAGIGHFGDFIGEDIEPQINIIELNIQSLVSLTYYFLPNIKKSSRGYILNVASIAALYPLPYGSVYGASKAFVLSFTKALRYELRNTNITISCLCPGDTDTNFMVRAGGDKLNFTMAPEEVAKIAVKSLLKGKTVIFPKQVKIISKLPKSILAFFVSKITSKYSNH